MGELSYLSEGARAYGLHAHWTQNDMLLDRHSQIAQTAYRTYLRTSQSVTAHSLLAWPDIWNETCFWQSGLFNENFNNTAVITFFSRKQDSITVIKWHIIKIDTWRLFVGSVLETCEVYLLWTSKQSLEIINNILRLTGIIWITKAKIHAKNY